MALTGENFCAAAKSAFITVMSDAEKFALVEGLGGLFIMLGTACISLASTYCGYLYITKKAYYKTVLVGTAVPTVVSTIPFPRMTFSRCFS